MTPEETQLVVADTNVLVYLLSSRPADTALAEQYLPHVQGRQVAIAFQSHAELLVAQEAQQWDRRQFDAMIGQLLVVPWSPELLASYVEIRTAANERSRLQGLPRIDAADGWIAATALLLDVPLVTHDRRLARSPLIATISELPDPG